MIVRRRLIFAKTFSQVSSLGLMIRVNQNRIYDLIVVGGGIMGCAIAREMRVRNPDMKIAIVEKEAELGEHLFLLSNDWPAASSPACPFLEKNDSEKRKLFFSPYSLLFSVAHLFVAHSLSSVREEQWCHSRWHLLHAWNFESQVVC